jgi:hypothetical protein
MSKSTRGRGNREERKAQTAVSESGSSGEAAVYCLEKLDRCVSIRAATVLCSTHPACSTPPITRPLWPVRHLPRRVLPTRIHAPRCCTCLMLSSSPEANVPCPGSQSDSRTDSSSRLALDGSGTRRTARSTPSACAKRSIRRGFDRLPRT